MSNCALKEKQVLAIIKKQGASQEKLLSIFLAIQEASGWNYVDQKWAQLVATELELPLSKIYDLLTFYEMFATEPRGRYIVEICKSAPCRVVQGDSVAQMFMRELGIKMGETTADRLFTLQYTSCIGACNLAPVAKIGEQIYGHLTTEKVAEIVRKYREGV